MARGCALWPRGWAESVFTSASAPAPRDPDRIVWQSALTRIGAFRCGVEHPSFRDSGAARNWCFVFPRTAVRIEHEHERAFAANPNVITFYNRGQAYLRHAVAGDGDRCDWFGFDCGLVRDAVRAFDPEVDRRPERPFRLTRAFAGSETYLRQRRIFQAAARAGGGDELAIEESMIQLLHDVVRVTYGTHARGVAHAMDGSPSAAALRRQREIASFTEGLLSSRWDESLRLDGIAAAAGVSPYHLCRLFRRSTGLSLHQYRNRMRVRMALEPVTETARALSDIAVDSGYCHHSHFTGAFGREFGCPPASLREPSRAGFW